MNNTFEDGDVYEAKIVDQIVTRNQREELQVVFTAEVSRKLTDESGSIDPFERDIYVTFADDEQKLNIALDHLRRLGFEDSEVLKLHPEHPEFISMVGKDVQVRCRIRGDATYWNFAWSRSRPAPVKLEEAQSAAAQLKRKIERVRGDSTDVDHPESPSTDSRPPVSY